MNKSTEKIVYGLWEYLPSPVSRKLFNICKNITLHFFKLVSHGKIDLTSSTSLEKILNYADEKNAKWCVVFLPGNIFKHGFFNAVKNELQSLDQNICMLAHIIDRKKRGFGFNEQFFIVNLEKWRLAGQPKVSFPGEKNVNFRETVRSLENIHDDYTPMWVKHTEAKNKLNNLEMPSVMGANLLYSMLENNNSVLNFSESIRKFKSYLYPEQNSDFLTQALLDIRSLRPSDMHLLSGHQANIIKWLQKEAGEKKHKLFIFNTENFLDIKNIKDTKPLDSVYCLASGTKELFLLNHFGFKPDTKLIYYDICPSSLHFKKHFWNEWSGKNYAQFVSNYLRENKNRFRDDDTTLTFSEDQIEILWKKECQNWGSEEKFEKNFLKFQSNEKQYIETNIISDSQIIFEHIKENCHRKRIAFWFSNCFNYTPTSVKYNWDQRLVRESGEQFLYNLLHISQKNNCDIFTFGEDMNSGTTSLRVNNCIYERFR